MGQVEGTRVKPWGRGRAGHLLGTEELGGTEHHVKGEVWSERRKDREADGRWWRKRRAILRNCVTDVSRTVI